MFPPASVAQFLCLQSRVKLRDHLRSILNASERHLKLHSELFARLLWHALGADGSLAGVRDSHALFWLVSCSLQSTVYRVRNLREGDMMLEQALKV
jgi:hypothetical protein